MIEMELWQLKQRQSLPLEAKIIHTQNVIRQWYEYWDGQVYVSFSGGKDSTVLLRLVREIYPEVPAVFVDTGLEYPEIRQFVQTVSNTAKNVVWLRPKLQFDQVIEKYGYPVISKEQSSYIEEARNTKSEKLRGIRLNGRSNGLGKVSDKWKFLIDAPFCASDKCCDYLKKQPVTKFEKQTGLKPMLGTMATESNQRKAQYIRSGGCNVFESKRPISRPLSIWNTEDIWQYINGNKLPYSSIYDKGETQTGCMFCMFGVHLEKSPNRFQRMSVTHPKQYDYCINKLGLGQVLDYIGVKY
jgi:3'-phosphoadenosine 5'-phosphosulfate sulfotransferase (PAPS reductase)/FAD synthetase